MEIPRVALRALLSMERNASMIPTQIIAEKAFTRKISIISGLAIQRCTP